jgi:hypothetical protein
MWAERGTYIAEIEVKVSREPMLEREQNSALIEQFYKEHTKGWRSTYFADKSNANKRVDSLFEVMNKSAKDLTPEDSGVFGMHILNRTSWNWQQIDTRSRKRDYKSLAQTVIVETIRINDYRTYLIESTCAGNFRILIRDILTSYSRPKILKGQKHREYTFPDRIPVRENSHKLPEMTFGERLSCIDHMKQVDKDFADIRQVVKLVQGLHGSSFDGNTRGPMEHNVSYALKKLVEVSSKSYPKKQYYCSHLLLKYRQWVITRHGFTFGNLIHPKNSIL